MKWMKEKVIISGNLKTGMLILTGIGALAFVIGLLTNHSEAWSAYLIANYYFFSLTIGALFFIAIQYITQSGWASAMIRVPEAMMTYMPFAAVLFLLTILGAGDLYHWSQNQVASGDPVILHKSGYLNIPFFLIRMVLFFGSWIILITILISLSRKSDLADTANSSLIMSLFGKSEIWSRIVMFVLAITFTLGTIDWILSVEPDWYSTIFALKNLVGSILHGVSVIALIVFILYWRGYLPFLNEYHLHDFARYIFMFAIIWGYFWFSQFLIIWYGNIPDETIYYYTRWQSGWKALFFAEIGLNWFLPFMILLPVRACRNIKTITLSILILVVGQYIDIFDQVMPGSSGVLKFGWIEAGVFLGFAGLYAFVVVTALSRNNLIARNHPYLDESLNHSFK